MIMYTSIGHNKIINNTLRHLNKYKYLNRPRKKRINFISIKLFNYNIIIVVNNGPD